MGEALSAEQYEIVQLLQSELVEAGELAGGIQADGNAEHSELFDTYEEIISNLANAAKLAGLLGFASACEYLVRQFQTLSQQQTLSASQIPLLVQWPQIFLTYIQAIGHGDSSQATVELIKFLAQPEWPQPLTSEQQHELALKFSAGETIAVSETIELPTSVTADMVSLVLADDVRPELVDGMLVELPSQVSVFEASISQYISSHAFDDLNHAQRIAHTLKGAANIVGVAGIANLMHYVEDLLENAVKHWQDAPDGFDDLLLNASDCLASQAEYLCGFGSEPDNTAEVMQEVLDWLRQLKMQATDQSEVINSSKELNAVEAEQNNTESLPAPADDLLFEAISESVEDESSLFDEALIDQAEVSNANVEPPIIADAATHIVGSSNETATPELNLPTQNQAVPLNEEVEELQNNDDEADKHFIHVPDATAQELLRISGESQIANTQLNAQIESLQTSIQLTDRYHKKIRQMAAELEIIVQSQSALRAAATKADDDQLDPLELERYSELYSFSNQLLELTADSYEAVSQIDHQIDDLNQLVYLQRQQNRDSQNLLLGMRLIPVSTLSSRFHRCVRQASRLTHKPARLEITGEHTLLDSRVLNRIADPILHLLRNAVDHGLERNAGLREQANKDAEGCIRLNFKQAGETMTIECIDDGAGLDYDAILKAANEKGLLQGDTKPDEAMLSQLIMMPGFSTRKSASQTSGRGIGLDAVLEQIKSLKGSVNVQSTAGDGCCFTIVVPTSIISGHAILVAVSQFNSQQKMALLTRNIEQIVFAEHEQFVEQEGGAFYLYQDEHIPILELRHLIGAQGSEDSKVTALLIAQKADGKRVAISVEAILASQDMVIKPLNDLTYHPDGVVGATILGDGGVAPVIDIQELPGMSLSQTEYLRLREQRERIAELDKLTQIEVPMALVVDDSLSARRSLAQFMSDLGMEVRTARDGFEAIKVLGERKPALMLVDLEMPRMNGLELTAHLRSREDTKDIPVIMITSRATEKHRSLAQKAGVNSYLNKPWTDEDLMATIQSEIA